MEDEYFSMLAQKAAAQQIEDIIKQKQHKTNQAMSIQAMWDMEIDLKRLKKQVDKKPHEFYTNFDQHKEAVLRGQGQPPVDLETPEDGPARLSAADLRQLDKSNFQLETKLQPFRTPYQFKNIDALNESGKRAQTLVKKMMPQLMLSGAGRQDNNMKNIEKASTIHDKSTHNATTWGSETKDQITSDKKGAGVVSDAKSAPLGSK